jgi:micrococcal nuclease
MNLLLAFVLLAGVDPPKEAVIVDNAVAIDGDTIAVVVNAWPQPFTRMLVRIQGIDSPELHSKDPVKRAAAQKAKTDLAAMIAGQQVKLESIGRDKYFRLLAKVVAGGVDCGAEQLRRKNAVPYSGGRKNLSGRVMNALPPTIDISGHSVALNPDEDNTAVIQAAVDSFNGGTGTITLPEGLWGVCGTINLPSNITFAGKGDTKTILFRRALADGGFFNGPIIGGGGDGRWVGSEGKSRADNVRVHDIGTLYSPGSDGGVNSKCIWFENGTSILVYNVRLEGGAYEGLVGGSWARNVIVTRCTAVNCGNGGRFYTLSTAGFNVMSIGTNYNDCTAVGCGQGWELGNTRTSLLRCVADEAGSGEPSMAFNIGSSVAGVYDCSIVNCRSRGFSSALGIGNGNGRLAKVTIRGNVFIDGSVSFMGGKPDNIVPHNDQGPDTYGSTIDGNTFIFTQANNDGSCGYNTGPAAGGEIYGREPLTVSDNVFVFAPGIQQSTPVIYTAGKVPAKQNWLRNWIIGIDTAGRGDLAVFSNNANVSGPGNIEATGNRAFFGNPPVERIVDFRREN